MGYFPLWVIKKTKKEKIKAYLIVMEMTMSKKNNSKKILYIATIYCTQEKKHGLSQLMVSYKYNLSL